jgi:hypothetical protein
MEGVGTSSQHRMIFVAEGKADVAEIGTECTNLGST